MSGPYSDIQYARYFTRSSKIPRGSTEVVMERLFPKERSAVPVDEDRANAVYAILSEAGFFRSPEQQEEGTDVQDQGSEGGFWEGEVGS